MAIEEYSIGYEDGKSAGFDECMAQQRTWLGLTEQERNYIEDLCEMMIGKPAFDAIEAKLKEKNGIAPQGSDK